MIQTVHRGVALTVRSWVLKDNRSGYDEEPLIVKEE